MLNILQSATSKVLAGVTIASVLLAGIFYWRYSSQEEKLVETKVELGKSEAVVKDQQVTLDKKIESDKVTDDTQVRVVTETKLIRETSAQIEARVRERIHQIRASVPKDTRDPLAFQKMNDEISKVRIEGLWELFCVNNPHSSDCAGFIPVAASGVAK